MNRLLFVAEVDYALSISQGFIQGGGGGGHLPSPWILSAPSWNLEEKNIAKLLVKLESQWEYIQ